MAVVPSPTPEAILQGQENTAVNKSLTPLEAPFITGMKLQQDVVINDLVLNTIDENGVVWVCTNIDGWWGHPEPEMRDFPRGFADGSFDVRGRWNAREITLEGVFLTPDPSLVAAARDKLISATSLVYQGGWLITYEDPPRAAYVRLNGKPEIETINARGRTEFSIGLRSADPIKYEWKDDDPEGYTIVEIPCQNAALSRPGEGTVTNIGNTEVTAIFEIEGPITGPATLQNDTTGQLLLIIDSVPAGSFLEIDTYYREVAFDGEVEGSRSRIDTLVDWITLAPGANTISFSDEGNANSTATLRVYYRSGWIG
jgi:hypothetical protein